MKKSKVFATAFCVALALAVVAGCATTTTVKEYVMADQSRSPSSWEEVLSNKREIEVVTLNTGEIKVGRGLVLLNLEAPAAKGLPDEKVWVTVYAHLIRHKEKGDFLVDTGYDRSFKGNSPGNLECTTAEPFGFSFKQEPGQDIKSQLEKHSAKPQGVFFTHMHPDHTSGIPDLPKNIRYVAGKDEMAGYMGLIGQFKCVNQLEGVKALEEIDFSSAKAMPPMGAAIDIFGDGSFWALSTPGHSVGHISYLVNGKDGPVLLVGDASHTKWGFENGVEPGFIADREAAQRSLSQLKELARQFPSIKVIYGHEPGQAEGYALMSSQAD
jgi:glyoxylase-like metal-dependent hydrolase (beta-lactamase superfamily II)